MRWKFLCGVKTVREHIENDRERWRAIVVHCEPSQVLLVERNGAFSLPSVEIPKGSRVARELNAQLKSVWNVDAFSLYPFRASPLPNGASVSRCHVLETVARDTPPVNSARWLPSCALPDLGFAEVADTTVIREWLASSSGTGSNRSRPRIGGTGSFAHIRAWVRQELLSSGLKLGNRFLQINASEGFSLVRFETDSDAVWFKAVGEPNTREFRITIALSDLFPNYTSPILAAEPLWNAWLASDVPGIPLSQRHDLGAWNATARDFAALQVASMTAIETILKCGAREVRNEVLLAQVGPFFVFLRELMDRQKSSVPIRLSPEELVQLESETRNALCELQRQSAPDSLGHLDLNPDNVIVLPDRVVFLDWAEACVGHPFLSFAYLLEHFRTHFPGSADGHTQLIKEYVGIWDSQERFGNVERHLCLAVFLAVFVHAVSTDIWRERARFHELRLAGYYRSLARRMKLYADRIRTGASRVCELWA
jgi:hypothetical protein